MPMRKARKNYAGTSPITRASGTRKVVMARYARTGDSEMRYSSGPFAACAVRPEHGSITRRYAAGESVTKPRCDK